MAYIVRPVFDTWSGGTKYLRIFSSLNDKQRRGWRTADVYKPGDRAFRLELRFNPRTQSRVKGIDQLMEVWPIDAGSQHKHIHVTVFSDGYGANRLFAYTNILISYPGGKHPTDVGIDWIRLVAK